MRCLETQTFGSVYDSKLAPYGAFNRTKRPYSSFLPVEDCNKISGATRAYQCFKFRLDIMIYALACYPSGFNRPSVMEKSNTSSRTQQRILQSLVREGFLEKSQQHQSAGAYYKLIPSKMRKITYALNMHPNLSIVQASEFLPKFDISVISTNDDTNQIYQHTTFRFGLCLDILTFAAARGNNGFTRKEIMRDVRGISERSQQRLLLSWVHGGFLVKGPERGNVCFYYFNPIKTELLLRLLNKIEF